MTKLMKNADYFQFKTEKSQEDYKNEFLKRRASVSRKTFNKGSIEIEDIYAQEYVEQCALAAGGDVVAQDLLAYWFKHGNPVIPENVELSYKWLFLAAAGGNKHSINKLSIFLNYAYDTILYSDYIKTLSEIMGIYEDNYQEILGQVICEYLVKELNIDAFELAKAKTDKLAFNRLSMQNFNMALNRAMLKVEDYFRNFIQKTQKGL